MLNDKINRENIAIVLVEPINSGNIGSAARAMKNMGFSDLRLVSPIGDHLNDEARSLAHGSNDILEKAKIFNDLDSATKDCCLLVGTSHKKVRNSQNTINVREASKYLAPYCKSNKIAILFGKESHGLSNETISLCTWIINIPSYSSYPSLNLAQAVMIVCYELFFNSTEIEYDVPKVATREDIEHFLNHIKEILDLTGFHHKNENPNVFLRALRRIFTRCSLEARDIRVLYKLFDQFKNYIK